MAATQIRPPGPPDGSPAAPNIEGPEAHRIRPRRGLPGGRAVVGGLLVTVAAVGIFAAVSGAGRGTDTTYVVAARDLEPGQEITAGDLELTAVALPDALQGRVFSRPGDVVGAIAVGPLSEGELVQAGGLADGADAAVPTFSLALPQADANAGDLQRGDVVQVVATYGGDTSGTTDTLAEVAQVVSVSTGEATVANADEVLLRLAVESADERAAIVNATVTGRIALIRITGADAPETADRFRPPDLDPDTADSGTAPPTTTAPEDEG